MDLKTEVNVSVIIPVFNDIKYIKSTLEALKVQRNFIYEFEVIVVDNKSTDGTYEYLVELGAEIVLLKEWTNLNSPYSCRNRGLEVAKGEVIVLLDSTCVPSPNLLCEGVRYLINNEYSIVGGNVAFDFKEGVTAAKIYDAVMNVQVKQLILEKQIAPTANLFIRKEVFNEVGSFEEGIRSGGDIRWTHRATEKGYRIGYCELAISYKPPRALAQLLKKQWRVGCGQPAIWREIGERHSYVKKFLAIVVPENPFKIKHKLNSNGQPWMKKYFFGVWFVGILMTFTRRLSNFIYMCKR